MTLRVLAGTVAASVVGAAVLLVGAPAVHAQTGCRTANCNFSTTPPVQCTNRATPYTALVTLTNSGISFIYVPATPKIEPDDCVQWMAVGTIADHSSSANDCADTAGVCSVVDTTCQWDSGNIAPNDAPPAEICHYSSVAFPQGTADQFYCRIHASPTAGTMRGTLNVTTPIDVQVSKDTVAGDVVLAWTGGGVTGDVTYRVVRNLVGDPLFTVGANTVTGTPDGGNTGATFRELGGLSDHTTHYYLVRNRQINE
jgi:hypothetical protein